MTGRRITVRRRRARLALAEYARIERRRHAQLLKQALAALEIDQWTGHYFDFVAFATAAARGRFCGPRGRRSGLLRYTQAAQDLALGAGGAGCESRISESRVVRGVHWASDFEAGRVVGASMVSRQHANPAFAAQPAGARKEIQYARFAGLKSLLNCAAETKALASDR